MQFTIFAGPASSASVSTSGISSAGGSAIDFVVCGAVHGRSGLAQKYDLVRAVQLSFRLDLRDTGKRRHTGN